MGILFKNVTKFNGEPKPIRKQYKGQHILNTLYIIPTPSTHTFIWFFSSVVQYKSISIMCAMSVSDIVITDFNVS